MCNRTLLGPCGLLLFLILFPPSRARAGDDPLLDRMEELRALFCEKPSGIEGLFDPSFLKVVPKARVKLICLDLFKKHGACTGAPLVEKKGGSTGIFLLDFEKGVAMQSTLSVAGALPHRIIGWWIGPPQPAVTTLEGVVKEFGKLKGSVSFALARLGKGEPEVLASLNPDTPLAIGSTFKLYVLGGAARAVSKGALRWDTVVPLRKEYRSFPSGQTQDWPGGAPVTVHTLAVLMISISDNTATDHLLFTVGRKAVEEVQDLMGNRHAPRNVPFLSTLELFKLKCARGGALAEAYLGLDAEGRRAFLGDDVRKTPRKDVELGTLLKPTRIDSLEWFASASDLVRSAAWLKRVSEKPAGKPVLDILAVNKGISIPSGKWPYAGFKGGSEPGVLNGTFLLRHRSGAWFALSAGWNDTEKDVDKTSFFGLIQRTVSVLAKTIEK